MNINNVEEIIVKMQNGEEIIYRGKGLEKIRRLLSSSPAYGQRTIIVEDSPSDEEQPAVKKESKSSSGPPNGYRTADLNYAPSKGMSAADIARQMQRQAEQSSGIQFS